MKSINGNPHSIYDATQTRLRLLLSVLENKEPEPADDDLESLDFTDSVTSESAANDVPSPADAPVKED
jgi:hypothetical protein